MTGKLAALVDLVTPSPVDNPDMFMGNLLEFKAKIVEANKSHQVVLQPEIKTAIFISMAPGENDEGAVQEAVICRREFDLRGSERLGGEDDR